MKREVAKKVTPLTPKGKWFYPMQKEVADFLDKEYASHVCQYQDVTENRVHENYLCEMRGAGTSICLHVIMSKTSKQIFIFKIERAFRSKTA